MTFEKNYHETQNPPNQLKNNRLTHETKPTSAASKAPTHRLNVKFTTISLENPNDSSIIAP